MSHHLSRNRWYHLCTSVLLILSILMPLGSLVRSQEAVDLNNVPSAQLKQQIETLLLTKKYEELIEPLTEYLKRLEENPTPNTIDERERLSYSLAYCLFISLRLNESVQQLRVYLEKFEGRNLTRTALALDMLGSALFGLAKYDEAAPVFEKLITNKFLKPSRIRELRFLLLECYVIPRQWDVAIPRLEEAVKDKSDKEFFGRCVVYLCQGYIETEQVEKIFEFLPDLEASGSVARYSISFNLSVLNGADRLLNTGRVDLALPLLLIVSPKRLIETWLNEQIDIHRGKIEVARAQTSDDSFAQIVEATENLRRLEAEKTTLDQTESYDEELRHRVAQAYFRQSRTWEALWIYESIIEDFGDSKYGEEAAYAGFAIAASLGLLERAADFGDQYIEKYPEGNNFDDVAHQLGQIYVELKRYSSVIKLTDTLLEIRPDSLIADNLLFLSGFSLFQQEKFDEAAEKFAEIRRRYPESESLSEAEYWRGMCFLFQSNYSVALDVFRDVSTLHTDTVYGVDATFRIGVCLYALEKYDESKAQLLAFVEKYPRSPQMADARVILGDIYGGEGNLNEALSSYRSVEALTLNQGLIDYAALQMARVLELQGKFEEMESSLKNYLLKYGTTGMYAEAIYRIGFAQKSQGNLEGLLRTYSEAIRNYGNERKAVGMDLILRDYITEYANLHGSPPIKEAEEQLKAAQLRGDKTLALRWLHGQNQILTQFQLGAPQYLELKSELLDDSSPALMLWLGQLALEKGNKAFALESFERLLSEFPETEWNEPALLSLARMARDDGDFETAILHYEELRKQFPASDSAALSFEEQALILMSNKKYREAISLLESVLEVKEWRGEIWARALYHIGEARLAIGEVEEAFGYFQRVYVLYTAYREWAAKAYIQSAQCLLRLGKKEERLNTLKEFVSTDSFRGLPEYAEASEILSKENPPPQAQETLQ